MRTFVKLTGLLESEAAKLLPEGGAAGFQIGVPGSPRSLTIERAAELVGELPHSVEAWAVVLDPSNELIHRLFDEVGVDRVEVHGAVPPHLEFLEIHHLVPSLPVPPEGAEGPLPAVPPAEDYSRLRLDAAGTPLVSGSGVRPNWEICARLVDENPGRKLLLGGDITPDTVADALAIVHPWGVDLAAGVEGSPGHPDADKVKRMLDAIAASEKGSP